jgi:hypothetical protein
MPEVAQTHCYLIVHHKDAPPHELYTHVWTDSWKLEEILTEPWVAEECRKAGTVYVYRVRYQGWPPCIACQVEVDTIGEPETGNGKPLVRVRFKNAKKLNDVPPFKALPADLCKWAGAIGSAKPTAR